MSKKLRGSDGKYVDMRGLDLEHEQEITRNSVRRPRNPSAGKTPRLQLAKLGFPGSIYLLDKENKGPIDKTCTDAYIDAKVLLWAARFLYCACRVIFWLALFIFIKVMFEGNTPVLLAKALSSCVTRKSED